MPTTSLDQRLQFIGVQLSGPRFLRPKEEWIDIERTLYEASFEIEKDSRLFSLLCSWVSVHGDYIIIEKLMKLQRNRSSMWLVAVAVCASNLGFHQWKRLLKRQNGQLALVDAQLALSSIAMKGEYPQFRKLGFLIPAGSIRIRTSDCLTPERLLKKNRQYRNRLLYGASWRADIITAVENGYNTPTAISRVTGCSYEPAHRILREYLLAVG